MRLGLPATADELWTQLKAKVRNQIRKGERQEFEVVWGRLELLDDFYQVFSRNMRDLGTPVFGRPLFEHMLLEFGEQSEICVLRDGGKPIAAGILVHGNRVTEVPSASSLREYNTSNANMWMYWQLLRRTVERGQKVFDFGRSSIDSNTFRFKEQWGAKPEPSVWQYFVRQGDADQMRPSRGRFRPFIQIWRRLPVPITRWIGPAIVRGIP
jgi:FemAB-related protein (PEP-CTERM system-associated)